MVFGKDGHPLVQQGILVVLDERRAGAQALLRAAGGHQRYGADAVVHQFAGQLAARHARIATSDIHLTLLQTLAITGAVIVSTPQQVALADARKGVDMYTNDKVNVPILGLVENMAWFTPAELPENKYYIFGKDGCKQLAEELKVPLLGQIPIVQSICESGDKGTPVALDSDTVTGRAFLQLAAAVVRQVDKRNIEMEPTRIVQVKK